MNRIIYFCLLAMLGQSLLAAVQVYDSREDFSAGPSAPSGLWRYQYANDANNTGPYTDLSNWAASTWQRAPWLSISASGGHPNQTEDFLRTFLAPAGGQYLVAGCVQAYGGNGSIFSITQGRAAGADSNVFSSVVSSGALPVGVLRKVVVAVPVSPSASQDQLHFRINCNGDLNNDSVTERYALCRVGVEEVPEAYTTTLATAFGTGRPEVSGAGLGQLGDKDPAGYPVWFYQIGMPGDSSSFRLLPFWTAAGYYQVSDWCTVAGTWFHPGPTEDASAVVTYSMPYKRMSASITFTAYPAAGSSDGVLVRIYLNDTLLSGCSTNLLNGQVGTLGTNRVVMTTGDCLYVTISPNASQNNDATTLSITISGVAISEGNGTVFAIR